MYAAPSVVNVAPLDAAAFAAPYPGRNEALAEDEMARDKAVHERIGRRVTEELNRA